MNDEGRCTARHKPGTWPYTARCVHPEHTDRNHLDGAGNRWQDLTEEQEGANERSVGDMHEPRGYTCELDWPPMASETDEW